MKPESRTDNLSRLKADYQQQSVRAERLRRYAEEQLHALLSKEAITLGVPMESRVKTWSSIEEKISRKSYTLNDISDLSDLVGIRLILLFRSDRDRLDALIKTHFEIANFEDAGERLGDAQFGYQSHHYSVRLKAEWLLVPSYADLGDILIEIQARTIAQHIWAAASHKLQYKREDSVPIPLRRTINRVSALLETVDLEFERVLNERNAYLTQQAQIENEDRPLNVNLVDIIATKLLPADNRDPNDDDLDEVLRDLLHFEIDTSGKLENLILNHYEEVMAKDRKNLPDPDEFDENPERTARGVYFTFAGLIRQALMEEFGAQQVREVLWSRQKTDDPIP